VRTRSKLIEVGGAAAMAMIAAALAAGMISLEPWPFLVSNCLYTGAAGLATGFVVLGILPFIEKSFHITTGMTLLDRWFLGLLILDGLCLIAMGVAAVWMLETLKRAQARTEPAIREVKALADTGKAMVEHAKQDGQSTVTRVKGLVERIKGRVDHTRELIDELKPVNSSLGKQIFNAEIIVYGQYQVGYFKVPGLHQFRIHFDQRLIVFYLFVYLGEKLFGIVNLLVQLIDLLFVLSGVKEFVVLAALFL